MEFARKVSDKVIFMEGGIILEEGSPEEIFTNQKKIELVSFKIKLESVLNKC